jgi:RNA polymerase-binding protein DksA
MEQLRYKRLLLAKRDEISAVQGDRRTLVPPAGAPGGDLLESASADTEAELRISLRQTDGRLLQAIDDALLRISVGTFGVCKVCKHPISKVRLEAVPWTRLCRDCKERKQSAA